MAVQQNKKSPSKRGMHRSHDFLTNPSLAIEPTTGEVHLRHHISPTVSTAARKSSRPKTSKFPIVSGHPACRTKPGLSGGSLMEVTVAVDCMGGDHGPARDGARCGRLSAPRPAMSTSCWSVCRT